MNRNSHISRLVSRDYRWEQHLKDKGIRINSDDYFTIFNYAEIGCDFSDPIVQEARGIIFDQITMTPVCWPFRKFGNYGEPYCDKIDWASAKVQEKLDGSICKLWYNNYRKEWQWSSNGVIDARNCDFYDRNFYELIRSADNYAKIDYGTLDKEKTYIFELVSKENKIVVDYETPRLYHIGTKSNVTGKESDDDIGIIKPQEYPLINLEECLEAVKKLNGGDRIEHEGFVVVDRYYNRIKIKTPEYLKAHYFMSGQKFSKHHVLDLLHNDDVSVEEIERWSPEWKETFDYYRREVKRVSREAAEAVSFARSFYTQLGRDRKAFASVIRENPYSVIMFRSLGNNKTAEILLGELSQGKYEDLIREKEQGDNHNEMDSGRNQNSGRPVCD